MDESISGDKAFIARLTEIVLDNLQNENFGVNDFSREAKMSRYTLHRKLKAVKQQNITQFIREVRLNRAMELLKQHTIPVSEIAYMVGFSSPSYFNHCFHEHFGFPPGALKKHAWIKAGQDEPIVNKIIPEEHKDSSGKNPGQPPNHKRRILLSLTAGIILLFLFFYFFYNTFTTQSKRLPFSSHEKSVLVLPFKNLSMEEENQYFADGIAEDILNNLRKIKELRVISRTSAEYFSEHSFTVPEIARITKANYVLEGSVRRYNDELRICVQLIDTRHDQHLWSENYDRRMTDVFAIQSDIARNVARELQTALSPSEKQMVEKIPTTNTEAYNYYLLGRHLWNSRTEEAMKQSIRYFEKAIETDPDYALAHAGLADAYFLQTWWKWGQWPEGYEKAKESARRALELDENMAEAYAILGSILCWNDWQWEESRRMFKKTIRINPNYALARQYYSELLEILNEKKEAMDQINKAIELDPVSFMFTIMKSTYYLRDNSYAEALEVRNKAEELYPGYSYRGYKYIFIYYRMNEEQKAIASLQKVMLNHPTTIQYVDSIASIYNESGMRGIFHWIIELEQNKIPGNYMLIANLYCILEEKELALNWLEKAMEARLPDLPRINCNADFDILRDEPRFLALIEEMGLTPYHTRKAR